MEDGEKQKKRSWFFDSPFQILCVSLLSLLVPLSFLLLSRLSLSNYYLLVITTPVTTDFSSLFSVHVLHYINMSILYIIISSIAATTLVHSLSGRIKRSAFQSCLYICWIVLFVLQASVFLGIEGNISESIDNRSFLAAQERWILTRVLFFLGLHEVMLMWFRVIVKPVVDDTIFGVYKEERWPERAAVAVTFGMMWWWKLRNEVEGLVAVAEVKRKLLIGLEGSDFVNWWIYYLCVAIGIVRVLKALLWVWKILHNLTGKVKKGCESCVVVDDIIV